MTLIFNSIVVFAVLFIIGYFLAAYVSQKNSERFSQSQLQIKTIFWIPIFAIFLIFAHGPLLLKLAIVAAIYFMMTKELRAHWAAKEAKLLRFYAAMSALALLSIVVVARVSLDAAYFIVFASVLSDIFAFFFGKLSGKFKLPAFINSKKTYDGVIGQVVGAFFGAAVAVYLIGVDAQIWLAVPVAIGAIAGDLFNSYIKRKLRIKDWSSAIPGHGGYLDRFASLGGSFLLCSAFVLLFIT